MHDPQDDVPIYPYEEVEREEAAARPNRAGDFYEAAAAAGFDTLTAVSVGLMLIGAGVLFLMAQLSQSSGAENALVTYGNILWWLAIGAGVILFGEVLARLVMPRYRSFLAGRLILVFVLLAIGAAGKLGVGFALSVILVGAGLIVFIVWFVRE